MDKKRFHRITYGHLGVGILFLFCLSGCTSIISSIFSDPISEDYGHRTIAMTLEDHVIELKSRINFTQYGQALKSAAIEINSYNGIVLLTGTAKSATIAKQAAQIAQKVRGVRQVRNYIRVVSREEKSSASALWLKIKIAAAIGTNPKIPRQRVKVVVDDGRVFLFGLLTPNEADRVVNLVQRVNGVKKVIAIFELIT